MFTADVRVQVPPRPPKPDNDFGTMCAAIAVRFPFVDNRLCDDRFWVAAEPVCIRNAILSLNTDNRHADFCSIIHRIFCSTFFTVEYCNNSDGMVDHPFIPDLETGSAVACTDIFKAAPRNCVFEFSAAFLPHFRSSKNGKYIQYSSIFGTLNWGKNSG